ncbi:surfactin synthase subunit 1 [Kordia sp. SMS9]|uniref:non-ribosomal peptide synthetase n=1 Tax=Kordia sp. SMS9 TaxID=2282170 RepID=UPI000E0CF641|nr:non-ribosomal peptide synthetase [Kordia sp. SMS9]AXG70689.1 surfactin synthase subunit 1 [Kordia sp. SMS9]
MIHFLNTIADEGIYIKFVDNKLKILTENEGINAETLQAIKEKKEELITYFQEKEKITSSIENSAEIPAIAHKENYELSSAQRRLWYLCQVEETSVSYNMPFQIKLHKNYNIVNFKKAIKATIARHEILRTIFKPDGNGVIKQWIIPADEFNFEVNYVDVRTTVAKEEIIQKYIQEDTNTTFDLSKGPLLTAALYHVDENEYVFYYNMHHIISDGWSLNVLANDTIQFYEAIENGKTAELPKLNIQYKDYAVWQKNQVESESYKNHKDFWSTTLQGTLPTLNLPTNKKRPKLKTTKGRTFSAYISPSNTSLLKSFIQEQGGSMYMSLLSIWNILCYKYTGQKDIIIGTPIAGRDHADLEHQIGFYVNTLALRNQVNPNDTFAEAYQKIKQTTLQAYKHQTYPFDLLVADLNLKYDTSRSALFDVLFVFQNATEKLIDTTKTAEDSHQIVELAQNQSKFDIEIAFSEVNDFLQFTLTYNTDVYNEWMIKNLMQHFQQLVGAVLKNPSQKIIHVDYLNEEEKQKIAQISQGTKVPQSTTETVVNIFKKQVQKTPNAIALQAGNNTYTYKELAQLSSQLGHYLKETYDVKSNDLIGILQGRNEWLIIAILGILKSGAAYVPINPTEPKERRDHIIEDSNCKLVIDDHIIENFLSKKEQYQITFEAANITPSNTAYVIYTSGSTGKPKGVIIQHKALLNYIQWSIKTYKFSTNDTVGKYLNIAFDASVEEIYPSILSGATLHILPEEILVDMPKLHQYINNTGITVMVLPAMITERFFEIENTTVRLLISGGDKLKNFSKKPYQVHNHYGPTETTVTCLSHHVTAEDENIPIGKPIDNVAVYILDDIQNFVPTGVAGEIHVSGNGLALGYLHQPELTNKKFIVNPFDATTKLYKTGDLGRRLPNGNIEYLGRIDNQVKIRGYRIELNEIENALQAYETIKEATVIIKTMETNEKIIVGYITSDTQQNGGNIKKFLKTVLPEYMIPTYFVQLPEMLINANGKIDKNALANNEDEKLTNNDVYVKPTNEKEIKIINIISQVLELDKNTIGIHDNFFDLGANSIKLVEIQNLMNKELNTSLKAVTLFSYPNVFELAQYLSKTNAQVHTEEFEDEVDISDELDEILDFMDE